MSDSVASVYGLTPALTIGHDGDLELPCSDALWQAQTAQEWTEARDAENDQGSGFTTPRAVRDALALLVNDHHRRSPTGITNNDSVPLQWSPFAVVVITHILSTRLWHLNQDSIVWRYLSSSSSSSSSQLINNPATRSDVSKHLMTALRRCHELITAYEDHVEKQRSIDPYCSTHAGLQLATAAETLRVCYGRTVPALMRLNCDSLFRGGLGDGLVAIQEYLSVPLERNAEVTAAVSMAYEGLCTPLRHGAQFFRKAGALNGSLEHIMAGWDNGEFPPPSKNHFGQISIVSAKEV